jgi:hypothetical protein
MKNVLDLTRRLKNKAVSDEKTKTESKKSTKAQAAAQSSAPVIDMTEARNEILLQERRKVKRTILSEFLGACALVPQKGLMKVRLHDISETGMSFDIETNSGHFKAGEEVAMRVYLNHVTYFPFVVNVQNIRFIEEEVVYRHGVNFVRGTINDEALHHFVKFIETVSASLQGDHGDIMVSNISR